jgi:diguanylate cyclase (GGDEF)-like protein
MAEQQQESSWPLAEKVALLVDGNLVALAAGTLVAIVLAVAHLKTVALETLVAWLALGTLITGSRLVLHILYRRDCHRFVTETWLAVFLIGIFLSGAFWGLAGAVVFPNATVEQAALIAFSLGGMCAGAVSVYSAVPYAFQLFAIPSILPFVASLLVRNEPVYWVLASVATIFLVAISYSAYRAQRTLGTLLGLRLANADLKHQATHDGLVDLLNHREFRRRLDNTLTLDPRLEGGCGLIFVDLDSFKQVNDTAGHLVGDQLLCQIADALKACSDSVAAARLGGDEFALLLHPMPQKGVMEIAQRIRKTIAETEVTALGQPHSVGASIGVAVARGIQVSPADLLLAADTACYSAKAAGRNQVHMRTLNSKATVTALADRRRANPT